MGDCDQRCITQLPLSSPPTALPVGCYVLISQRHAFFGELFLSPAKRGRLLQGGGQGGGLESSWRLPPSFASPSFLIAVPCHLQRPQQNNPFSRGPQKDMSWRPTKGKSRQQEPRSISLCSRESLRGLAWHSGSGPCRRSIFHPGHNKLLLPCSKCILPSGTFKPLYRLFHLPRHHFLFNQDVHGINFMS